MFFGPVPMMFFGVKKMKLGLSFYKAFLKIDKRFFGGFSDTLTQGGVRLANIINFMFGPVRQIATFNLIVGTYYVNKEGEAEGSREMFWIKIALYVTLIVLPAVIIQHCFLASSWKCSCKFTCQCIWSKIPFIYGIPVFTGVFTSVKELKSYHIRDSEELGGPVLQVSHKARIIYRLIRIFNVTAILIVIWKLPYLRTLRIDYFIYMHIVNGLDAITLIGFILSQVIRNLRRRCYNKRYLEDVRHIEKCRVFHPDLDHDCTYKTSKIIGKFFY